MHKILKHNEVLKIIDGTQKKQRNIKLKIRTCRAFYARQNCCKMSAKSTVSICARWLGTALGPTSTVAAAAGSAPEPIEELRSRLLLLDSLKPEDLALTLADGRLLRRLRRRLIRSKRESNFSLDQHQSNVDLDDELSDNDNDGEANQKRVSRFLDSCRKDFHLPAEQLFELGDLVPEPGGEVKPERVLRCLTALSQSDAVAAAGFASDALLPVSVGDVAISVADEHYATVRWDLPVLNVLDQLVGIFRACCTLARHLRESPLSLWPRDAVDALFGRSADLLELLCGLRSSLLNEKEKLDQALSNRQAQLVRLYAGLWWDMILTGNQKLRELDKACQDQVTLALTKLPQAVESAAKCVMDLQQMPVTHLRKLTAAAESAMTAVSAASDEKKRLEASVELLKRVDERVNRCLVVTKKYMEPSCAEFEKLKWPSDLQFDRKDPRKLGRLRRTGTLHGPDGKQRLHASLWDGALVLSLAGEVQQAIKIGPNTKFEEIGTGVNRSLNLTKRSFSFRISVGNSSAESITLSCESLSDRQEWLKAFNTAQEVWNPSGFDKHGHWFVRTAASPDIRPPPDTCRHCGDPIGCWAHRCERCGVWLHRRCVTPAFCTSDPRQQHIRCKPPIKPRGSLPSVSSQEEQKQEPQNWSEPEPIDADLAKVKIRQLPELQPGRRRNFLLCPSSKQAMAAAADSAYQLHVLSGEAVFTYRVESIADARMLRISGAGDIFPGLKDLVRHYESNPLPPPPPPSDDDEIYDVLEPPPDKLLLDSGVADC